MAHAAGVVHRDVKPSNLILDVHGVLRLTDFGLARVEGDGPKTTLAGDVLGTPAYMSPEQAAGDGDAVGAQADIYSLGATLYEVLTLRPPFRGASPQEICAKIASKDPVPPRRFDARIPRDLETIVQKAMEKDRGRRYRTAAGLARDLRLFAEGAAIHARRVGFLGRTWRNAKRHRTTTALVAGVLVLAAGVVALTAHVAGDAAARRNLDALRRSAPERTHRAFELMESDPAAALAEFDRALEADPHSFEALLGKGRCLLREGRSREALQCFERAVAAAPHAADARRAYAATLLRLGLAEDATREFERVLADAPRDLASHVDRWSALTLLGRHADALGAVASARPAFPGEPVLARLQVASLRALGRPDAEVLATAAEAAVGRPSPETTADFAYLCAVAGEDAEARTWLRAAERTERARDAFGCARVHAALREREETLHWLEVAAAEAADRVVVPEPDFAFVADDPRIRAAMARLAGASGVRVEPTSGRRADAGGPAFPPLVAQPVDGAWSSVAPLPSAAAGVALADVGGTLYAVGGGLGGETFSDALLAYDSAANAWLEKAPMPTPRGDVAVGVLAGKLYVVGGTVGSGAYTAALEVYDPLADAWSRRRPLTTERSGHGLGALGGRIYVVGGRTNDVALATTEVYDPAADAWTTAAPLPTPRSSSGVAVLAGRLYVVGGERRGVGAVATVESYDPETDAWAAEPPLPEPRSVLACAVLSGRLYAVGGGGPGGGATTMFVLDPASRAWARVRGPSVRTNLGLAVSRGRLLAAGGNCDGLLASVEAFAPADGQTLTSVAVAPPDVVLPVGSTRSLTATGSWSDGASRTLAGGDYWSTLAPMATEHTSAAVGVVRGRILVAGGGGVAANYRRLAETLDLASGAWTPAAPMPTGRGFGGTNGACVDGVLFAIGGSPPGYATSVNEAYDPATDSWASRAPMPTARCHLAVVAVADRIYAVGGTDTAGSIRYPTVEVYDPRSDSWSEAAPMPTGRTLLAAGVVGNRIHVVGGADTVGGGRYLAVHEAYDTSSDTWATKAPLPFPMAMLAVGVVDGTLYVVGGALDGVERLAATVLAYDGLADAWSARAPLPAPRLGVGVTALDGVLYACGGNGPAHPEPTVFAYHARAEVRWSSGDPSVARVDGSGLVTALGAGTTTIAATAADGATGSALVTVVVDRR